MTAREPSVTQLILGDVLAQFRKAAGMSQDQLATKTNYSRSQISMTETGQLLPSSDFVSRCEDVLGTDGLLMRVLDRASRDDSRVRISDLTRTEEQAAAIRSYNPVLVPGLLQTEGYMRHQFGAGRFVGATDDEIDERVRVRQRRQEVLRGLRSYLVILDEGVLCRVIGGAHVMREQLAHLIELAHSPRINVQIMPFATLSYPAAGPMTIFDMTDGSQALHLDGPISGSTTTRVGIVQDCTERFEMLRSQAASLPESVQMINDRMEDFT